jgi:hypothetical protein
LWVSGAGLIDVAVKIIVVCATAKTFAELMMASDCDTPVRWH